MRYEKKFPFEESNLESIYSYLLSFGFIDAYPERQVNSIYYDTNEFFLYNISEAGISDRLKKRIRWYDNKNELILEYKIKESELGIKKTNKKFLLKDQIRKIEILNPTDYSIQIKKIPSSLENIYLPNVGVTYKRKYLISVCGTTRITLDYQIKFARIFNGPDNYQITNWIPFSNSVLEIKYEYLINNKNLELNKFIDKFGLQFSRFYKYCYAIKTCF